MELERAGLAAPLRSPPRATRLALLSSACSSLSSRRAWPERRRAPPPCTPPRSTRVARRRVRVGHPGRGADRCARERASIVAVAVAAVLVARWRRTRRALEIARLRASPAPSSSSSWPRSPLRLAILLHPQFYYPDVQRARALRLAARAPRAHRVPARLHREPVPLQPRPADGERALVRVPLSAGLLRALLAARRAGAHATGGRGLGARGGRQQPGGVPRLRHRAAPARAARGRRWRPRARSPSCRSSSRA